MGRVSTGASMPTATRQMLPSMTESRESTTRPTSGEMLVASPVSETAGTPEATVDGVITGTDCAIAADDPAPRSVLMSQVENGAVNGDAASTTNNQVQAKRIM